MARTWSDLQFAVVIFSCWMLAVELVTLQPTEICLDCNIGSKGRSQLDFAAQPAGKHVWTAHWNGVAAYLNIMLASFPFQFIRNMETCLMLGNWWTDSLTLGTIYDFDLTRWQWECLNSFWFWCSGFRQSCLRLLDSNRSTDTCVQLCVLYLYIQHLLVHL